MRDDPEHGRYREETLVAAYDAKHPTTGDLRQMPLTIQLLERTLLPTDPKPANHIQEAVCAQCHTTAGANSDILRHRHHRV